MFITYNIYCFFHLAKVTALAITSVLLAPHFELSSAAFDSPLSHSTLTFFMNLHFSASKNCLCCRRKTQPILTIELRHSNSIWKEARRFKISFQPLLPILIPNTQVYAYTNEEKANAIALNLESQFQGNIIVDYNTEREVNDTVRWFLREDIPPF